MKVEFIYCKKNAPIPNNTTHLYCKNISTLPSLPPLLTELYCDYNLLTNLPELPPNLIKLDCENNSKISIL
jgi:Leucine-rich repeat (LRR) protein